MQLQYDLMIRNLNIVVWKLRYPILLEHKTPIRLLINLRLLIISDLIVSLDDVFIKDVIRAMNVSKIEVCIITVDQINNLVLPTKFLDYCWWIGIQVSYNFYCINFNTPSLMMLKGSVHFKRDLWSQIYNAIYCNRCLER